MQKLIIYCLILLGLNGCGGGGGNGSNGEDNLLLDEAKVLSPLQIATLDLNNNPIPYIDIGKIGIHTVYKLKFTNTNEVSVNLTGIGDTPDSYDFAMAQSMGITYEEYWANYAPTSVDRIHVTTSNADDCLNQAKTSSSGASYTPLEPGASCSYYTYAYNIGNNHSNESMFTQPVSYFIYGAKSYGAKSNLMVVQCSKVSSNPPDYNCNNMKKPGFSSQFIKYKMLPLNGSTNLPYFGYGGTISKNGNWFWSCNDISCNQYAINYNESNNSLIKAANPSNTVAMIDLAKRIMSLYSSLDGTSAWVSSYNKSSGYSLVNTARPNVILSSICTGGTPCVPHLDDNYPLDFVPGVIGLDGSFWWNNQNYPADVFDPVAQTFLATNIPSVKGVNSDGVVIAYSGGVPGCWTKSAVKGIYTYRGPLLNYINPMNSSSNGNFASSFTHVYMRMVVDELINARLQAYYKVHTENGLCQLNLDDYTFKVPDIKPYLYAFPSNTESFSQVISTSNVYLGL
jgi:hypothetical protein